MPDSPRPVPQVLASCSVDGTGDAIRLLLPSMAEADRFVRHAIRVRTAYVERNPVRFPFPDWPEGRFGSDIFVPGWMYPYVADVVNEAGSGAALRGFVDLRIIHLCAISIVHLDPTQVSTAPFKE